MIMVYCTFNLPFAIWTLRPTVDAIPRELDEAAYVDGASTWKVITEVVFPLCRPGLAVTLILTWVFAWNEYLLAATLTNFEARTLTTGLSEYVTTTSDRNELVRPAVHLSCYLDCIIASLVSHL